MGNLTCIMAHTHPGQEVICDKDGHIYSYEMASLCALGGVLPRIVNGEDGVLSWDAIKKHKESIHTIVEVLIRDGIAAGF